MPVMRFLAPLLITALASAASSTPLPPDGPPYEIVSVNVSTPSNNAPLNKELAYYRLNGTNGHSSVLSHSFVPVSCGAVMSVHYTDPHVFPDAGTTARPILLLQHGYPESSYIWRKLTAQLSQRVPLVVADRPGHGLSTVCPNGTDERTNAGALLDAAVNIYGSGKSVVLAAHDRGARSMQRAAVDIGQGGFPQVKALGLFVADIVPIVEEYASFSNPNYSTGYFHWMSRVPQRSQVSTARTDADRLQNFLPRVQGGFSTNVIMAYGGGNWVDYINHAGSGINETAQELFFADNALETYHTFIDQLSVTNASVYDYWSGATVDYLEMVADQAAGRRIKMPTHVEHSEYNLVTLSGFNVSGIWEKYVDPSANLTTEGVCCGQGHFIVELAPEQTIAQLNAFLDRLGVLPAS